MPSKKRKSSSPSGARKVRRTDTGKMQISEQSSAENSSISERKATSKRKSARSDPVPMEKKTRRTASKAKVRRVTSCSPDSQSASDEDWTPELSPDHRTRKRKSGKEGERETDTEKKLGKG